MAYYALFVVTGNERHLLFKCLTNTPLRSRYMPDSISENDHKKYFVRVINDELQENILN